MIEFHPVGVGTGRMAARGGAFSAALSRSQDQDIVEQKHRHADRLFRSSLAHRLLSSPQPTSNKFVHLENYFHARCRATVFIYFIYFHFFQGKFQCGSLFVDD